MSPVLDLDRLSVTLRRRDGTRLALLEGLSLSVAAGEMTALVGESGSGKTIAALGMIGLLPRRAEATGRVLLAGTDLLTLPREKMRRVRGGEIGMVFQNPLAALNPAMRVGRQVEEVYRLHTGAGPDAARAQARALFDEVGIPRGAERLDDFPHQFSGGMRQRVMIAMALACGPRLLIADEPTTGLDALVARQILALITRLCRERGMGVLFITHDLSIVEAHAARVTVLYAGRAVEWGRAADLFATPRHPYTRALLGAVPGPEQARLVTIPGTLPDPAAFPPGCRFAPRCVLREAACEAGFPATDTLGGTAFACRRGREPSPVPERNSTRIARPVEAAGEPVLEVSELRVEYDRRRSDFAFRRPPPLLALAPVSFTLRRGECLGVVGESGSGKSSLGRAVLQMLAHEGTVRLGGADLERMRGKALAAARRRIQAVFQDPRESMNPRMRIGDIVAEPLRLAGVRKHERRAQAAALLDRVGLGARLFDLLPGQVSGGEAQRVAIARALAAAPDVIVLDEPTSSLDVSTQALLLNLLKDLASDEGLSYILISHDIATVFHMADRLLVLREGHVIEAGVAGDLLAGAKSDYTKELIAAGASARWRGPEHTEELSS